MQAIIIQGMTCLGKSTLCKQIETDLPKCKTFSLDTYKENVWDIFGFDSVEQRDRLSAFARELFYCDINDVVKSSSCNYILIEYTFTDKYWSELIYYMKNWNILIKTIYLKPFDLQVHKEIWNLRSRDFSVRHPGHGATHYHNGKGSNYVNNYYDKIHINLPTTYETLEIGIDFNPYKRSVSYKTILDFISTS